MELIFTSNNCVQKPMSVLKSSAVFCEMVLSHNSIFGMSSQISRCQNFMAPRKLILFLCGELLFEYNNKQKIDSYIFPRGSHFLGLMSCTSRWNNNWRKSYKYICRFDILMNNVSFMQMMKSWTTFHCNFQLNVICQIILRKKDVVE